MAKPKSNKKYLVSLAKPDARIGGMDVGGKLRKFSKSGHSFILSDKGEANELSKEFGETKSRDIIVSEIPGYTGREDVGHRYNFTVRKGEETLDERRERMREDGWVEFKPGQWKKVAQVVTDDQIT